MTFARVINLLFVLSLLSTLVPDAQSESLITRADPQDRSFVRQAALGGLAEVQLGELARQQAQDEEVRTFAGRMVDEHRRTHERLVQLASAAGAPVPEEPDRRARREVDRLEKLSGRAFDRAYLKRALDDHRKALALFEKHARKGKDPNLKAFAVQTVPILQSHLDMVRQIGESAGG